MKVGIVGSFRSYVPAFHVSDTAMGLLSLGFDNAIGDYSSLWEEEEKAEAEAEVE